MHLSDMHLSGVTVLLLASFSRVIPPRESLQVLLRLDALPVAQPTE